MIVFTALTKKKFIIAALLAAAALGLGFIVVATPAALAQDTGEIDSAPYVDAQGNPSYTAPTGSTNTLAGPEDPQIGLLGKIGFQILIAILWIIQKILVMLFNFLSGIFSTVMEWNVTFLTTPIMTVVVSKAWTVVRDIMNAFFIIILLWIAITIIFNLENLGGRRLLFRVIVVALLMNFSLVIVSTVFGFTNALANTFYEKMPRGPNNELDLLTFLDNQLNFRSVVKPINQTTAQESQQQAQQQAAGVTIAPASIGLKNVLASAVGIESADAVLPIVPILLWTLAGSAAVTGISSLFSSGKELHGLAFQYAASDLFLLTIVIAIFFASIALFIRLIVMAFLGVLAPAAFALHIVPGKYGDQYWNQWLDALLRWSFFAPLFFLLFYVSLFMLTQVRQVLQIDMTGYAYFKPQNVFAVLLVASFMIGSVMVARKAAGATGSFVSGWARSIAGFGVGLAAGGLALGGRIAARTEIGRKTIGGVAETVSRVPVLNKVAAPVTRRAVEALEKQKGDALAAADKVKSYSKENIAQLYRSTLSPIEKAGYAIALTRKEGGISMLNGTEQGRALEFAKRFGVERDIYKAAPHLAAVGKTGDEARKAIEEKVKDIKANDAAKLSEDATKGEHAPMVAEAVWKSFSAAHWGQVASGEKGAERMTELIEQLRKLNTARADAGQAPMELTRGVMDYFNSSPGMQAYRDSFFAALKPAAALKTSPHLAALGVEDDREVRRKVGETVRAMSPQDAANLSTDSTKDPRFAEAAWKNFSAAHWGQVAGGEKGTERMAELVDQLKELTQRGVKLDVPAEVREYFTASPAMQQYRADFLAALKPQQRYTANPDTQSPSYQTPRVVSQNTIQAQLDAREKQEKGLAQKLEAAEKAAEKLKLADEQPPPGPSAGGTKPA